MVVALLALRILLDVIVLGQRGWVVLTEARHGVAASRVDQLVLIIGVTYQVGPLRLLLIIHRHYLFCLVVTGRNLLRGCFLLVITKVTRKLLRRLLLASLSLLILC